jgi:hypothetical protein
MTMFVPPQPQVVAPVAQTLLLPEKRKLTVFTNSEAQAFRDCRRKWWFTYVRGLRPEVAAKALTFGTAFHAGCESLYRAISDWRGKKPENEIFEQAIASAHAAMDHVFADWIEAVWNSSAELNESFFGDVKATVELARWCLVHYATTFRSDIVRLVPVAIERPFAIVVRDKAGRPQNHLRYQGVWDLVAWDPVVGDLVIFDHKTTSGTLDNIDRRVELDQQMGGYLYALREMIRAGVFREQFEALGIPANPTTGRIIYNVMRKKMPSVPHVNKDGSVSTAACDTTPEIFRAALEKQTEPEWLTKARDALNEASADPKKIVAAQAKYDGQVERWDELRAKQNALLDQLENRGEAFVSRREFWKSDAEIELWRQYAFAQGNDIRAAERDERFRYPNPGHCTTAWSLPCVYRSLCIDDTPEIAASFRVEPRHAEVEAARKRDEEV